MRTIRACLARLRNVFNKPRADADLAAELESHLQFHIDDNLRTGMSPKEARRQALIKLGGLDQTKESYRDRRGLPWLESLLQDIRFAFRVLEKNPGFTAMAVLTLALGVGANTAVFSIVNGILLHPLRFPHPENLVGLFERSLTSGGNSENPVAPADYLNWKKQTTTLDQIAAISYARLNVSGTGESALPERIDVCACSTNLFDTLEVTPALGRKFRPEEDRPGGPQVVVISYSLWKRMFAASPAVVSSSIKLDSRFYTVVGVMPADFSYPERSTDAWIPIETWLSPVTLQSYDDHLLTLIGRLRPGVSVAQANAEIDAMMRRYDPRRPRELAEMGASVAPLADIEVRGVRKLSLLLFGAVSCVLLIACVNVANLLLSKSVGRRREVAIRAALGAARRRVFRQLLVESVVMSLLGGLVGALLAVALVHYLTAWAPGEAWLPQSVVIRVDPVIFFFSFGLAFIAGAIAGLFPALQTASSLDVACDLRDSGRSATVGRSLNRFREILVAAEVTLSLILLVAAGLLIRSFGYLASTDLGLRTSQRLTMRLSLPDIRYHERAQISAFLQQLSTELQSLPGVIDVGMTSCPAITLPGFCPDSAFQIENQVAPAGRSMDAQYREINPDFFRAAGIPLTRGRSFTLSDGIGLDDKHPHAGAVIVNQAFAKKFFKSEDPIGRFITLSWFVGNNAERSALRYRIIGVSGDVLERPQSPAQPTFYLPLLDGDSSEISIILHTAASAATLGGAARSVVQRLDPDLAVFGIQSMDESLSETTYDRRFVMTLLAAFACAAVVLAAIGLYGLVSWGVSQRRKEIAIRIALGASRSDVHWMTLLSGLRPAVLGIVIGIPTAAFLTRFMRGLLFDIRPIDPLTFVLVPLMLLVITILASSVPALRASRVDPTMGLRLE